MRIACLIIPAFSVSLERLREPALEDALVIVFDRNQVLEASPQLFGCTAGLSLRKAKALYPDASFCPADHARYRSIFEKMLAALEEVTPVVEPGAPGKAFAAVGGLQGHARDEFVLAQRLVEAVRDATGLLPSAGIAEGKFVAQVAAESVPAGDAGVVPIGREQEFLHDKSIAVLPFGREIIERLRLLALRTLGDVAALPEPAVQAQFRSQGKRLWELSNGIDYEPLRPRMHEELLTELIMFTTAIVSSEGLIAAGKQIIARLVRRLRGRTARRMHVQLLAEGRIVWERLETFREPTGEERTMVLLLKTRLALLQLSEGVDTVVITLSGIGSEIAKQSKLFLDTQQNLNQVAESIRQLRVRYGRPVVWRITEVDPWSRHPEERNALVPYDV
jgi:DNA polymerase-4